MCIDEMTEDKKKQLLIEEIQRRISELVRSTEISESEKVSIARCVLNEIEHAEREVKKRYE